MAKPYKHPWRVIQTVLAETDSMTNVDEIGSFMRQALHRGGSLDDALENCLRGPAPFMSDASQTARFRRAAEQIWSELRERYDGRKDAAIAPVRDAALALVQRIADWIRSLDGRGIDPEELPIDQFRSLGELAVMMSSALDVVERDEDADENDHRNLIATFDQLKPIVEETISDLEASLSGRRVADPRRSLTPDSPDTAFTLKITLKGIQPPIWRRVRVPGNYTLGMLHTVIQIAMGWDDYHMHDFEIRHVHYADSDAVDELDDEYDEDEHTLDSLGLAEKSRFRYVYDFGDNWDHTVLVERIDAAGELPAEERNRVRCLTGKRACPPEDCGGVFGYLRVLELQKTPPDDLDDDDVEYFEMFGDEFDPEEFDCAGVDGALQRYST